MLSFIATGMPYKTPDGCAADACATSDLRSSLIGGRQAFSRLTLTMRSAAALALASASLGSLTLRRPRTARAWAPGRSRPGTRARTRRVRMRGARASLRRRDKERKSGVEGESGDLGGRRLIKKKK